jgi:hypothetical protein
VEVRVRVGGNPGYAAAPGLSPLHARLTLCRPHVVTGREHGDGLVDPLGDDGALRFAYSVTRKGRWPVVLVLSRAADGGILKLPRR